ncbi:6-pyruvoyl tetrahydropterin synthase family protein [Streptomyces sp. NPDC048527]|uniref:6-pyruvoyl trahydropterin synthase family protein n=1 Tax=Streptomyces sp. NPDC048527 TaxID=3365568 RepID=UPI0037163405
MPYAVAVRHNFESAHRLPNLSGKCNSLHGHSWWAEITVEAPTAESGIVVEIGAFKKAVREWIDEHLDHGTLLGPDDPLGTILRSHQCKVYDVPGWPTVENVAALLADVASKALAGLDSAPGARVSNVRVDETRVNSAVWQAE